MGSNSGSLKAYRSIVRIKEDPQNVEECGFAASIGTCQTIVFNFLESKVSGSQHLAVTEDFGNGANLKNWLSGFSGMGQIPFEIPR